MLTIQNFDKIENQRIGDWIIQQTQVDDAYYLFQADQMLQWNYPMIEVTIDRDSKGNFDGEEIYEFTAMLHRSPTISLPVLTGCTLKRKHTMEMYKFLDYMEAVIGNVR